MIMVFAYLISNPSAGHPSGQRTASINTIGTVFTVGKIKYHDLLSGLVFIWKLGMVTKLMFVTGIAGTSYPPLAFSRSLFAGPVMTRP